MMTVLLRRALAAFNEFGVLVGWACWTCWAGGPPAEWLATVRPRATDRERQPLSVREHRAWTRLTRDLTLPPDLVDAWDRADRS